MQNNFEDFQNSEHQIFHSNGKVIHQWQALEFEKYEKSGNFYLVGLALILALIVYALYTNSPIMAITFILIGVVGYIYLEKEPRIVTFSITTRGILIEKKLFEYESIDSFWIFYDHHSQAISMHTKASILPFVHIPLGDEDPVQIRKLLLPYIKEIKQEHSLVDTLEKVLHI